MVQGKLMEHLKSELHSYINVHVFCTKSFITDPNMGPHYLYVNDFL